MGFKGIGPKGGGRKTKPPQPPKPPLPFYVEIPEFTFPNPDIVRVNYGETLKNIRAGCINNSAKKIKLRLKMYLLYEGTKLKDFIKGHDFELSPNKDMAFGPFEETFIETKYRNKGKYIIKAVLLPMEDIGSYPKGYEKIFDTRSFYLEEDPPSKGLFEDCKGTAYPEEYTHILGRAEPSDSKKGYIYRYNTEHSAYKTFFKEEDELTDYLLEIMAQEIPSIDLQSSEPQLFKKEDLKEPDKVAQKIKEIVGKILGAYYSI